MVPYILEVLELCKIREAQNFRILNRLGMKYIT